MAAWQRWTLVLAIGAVFYLTRQNMLLAVGGVAVYRAFQKTDFEGDRTALATYVVLVFALAWLSGTHSAGN